MLRIAAFAALVAVAVAAPAGPPAPGYGHPAPVYEDAPPVYNYAYAAKDDYSGVNFSQTEARDGYATSGSYTVALPDGRIQTVTYKVDDAYGGYIADVQYTGEAHYDAYKPAPAPAYKPAPVYHPAPAPYHG